MQHSKTEGDTNGVVAVWQFGSLGADGRADREKEEDKKKERGKWKEEQAMNAEQSESTEIANTSKPQQYVVIKAGSIDHTVQSSQYKNDNNILEYLCR